MPSIVFPLIALGLHALLAYYVWRRLVRDTGLPRPWRRAATITIVGFEALLPVTMWASRTGATGVAAALAWPAFLWLGLFGITIVALLAIDLARLLAGGALWVARRARPAATPADPVDPSRRELIARITGGVAVAAAAGQVAVGMRRALGEHRVVDVPVALRGLPEAFDGFTIAQLSDVHVGLTVDRGFVADVVAAVNAAGPDLIAITGDLVDGPAAELAPRIAPLAELRAPYGTYFVTGNHEYYSGVEPWLAELRRLGVQVLRNQRVQIARPDAGVGFELAGIDDHGAARFGGGHGPDLAAAVAGRDPSRPLVLLAHQPRQVADAVRHGVDLQLSGHTHGGQIWPWHYIVGLQQGGLLAGRYRRGDTQLYVSRGVGYWGPPVRVGAPPEIARIILRRA
ncbi:MAG: metallophosphoesterase [Kofleriaceae bacterium]|nr:metallophosphoesterase [Kofleriaceae bacterium]